MALWPEGGPPFRRRGARPSGEVIHLHQVEGVDSSGSSGLSPQEAEQLRQESATFSHKERHAGRWELLRFAVGCTILVFFVAFGSVSVYVLLHPAKYTTTETTAAALTVLAQTVPLVMGMIRLIVGRGPEPLNPITRARDLPRGEEADEDRVGT